MEGELERRVGMCQDNGGISMKNFSTGFDTSKEATTEANRTSHSRGSDERDKL